MLFKDLRAKLIGKPEEMNSFNLGGHLKTENELEFGFSLLKNFHLILTLILDIINNRAQYPIYIQENLYLHHLN